MNANYDNIARLYDRLAVIVFGSTIRSVNEFIAEACPPESNILIAGGGSGLILELICSRLPSGLEISYIDSSAKMIALAEQRPIGMNRVKFYCKPILEFKEAATFDVVITPFLFDNFSEKQALEVFFKLNKLLRKGGLWLYADFREDNYSWWQYLLVKIMYVFFRVVCNVEAKNLPPISRLFSNYHYKLTSQKWYYNRFITSKIYSKGVVEEPKM